MNIVMNHKDQIRLKYEDKDQIVDDLFKFIYFMKIVASGYKFHWNLFPVSN